MAHITSLLRQANLRRPFDTEHVKEHVKIGLQLNVGCEFRCYIDHWLHAVTLYE